MNSKEKAKELIDKYFDCIPHRHTSRKLAIRCAIIAVDEILKTILWASDFNDARRTYWANVKEKLTKQK